MNKIGKLHEIILNDNFLIILLLIINIIIVKYNQLYQKKFQKIIIFIFNKN